MRPDSFVSVVRVLAALVVMATVSGCPGRIVDPPVGGGGGSGGGSTGGGPGGGTGGGGDVDAGYTKSAKGNVRFKGDFRMTLDFTVALGLPLAEVCNELGMYPCVSVHTVALQGVDPYGKGLYEPLPVTGSTTPAVVDRMALAACVRRVEVDLMTPASAVIFKSIALTSGKLSNPQSAEVRLAINELGQRAWLRTPTDAEVAHLVKLATDIEALGGAEPGKTWMQAACFAVLTSTESIFY